MANKKASNQKVRLLLYGIGLMLLATLTWLAVQKKGSDQTDNLLDVMFAVRDTANIDKIFIAGKDGSKYTLKRLSKTFWTINDKIAANPNNINALLEVIHDVAMKRPVTKNERVQVVKEMASMHQKVEIYNKGELVRTYYVGPSTVDNLGNYFLMEGGEDPYVCHIPGFEGYLDIRYRVSLPDWQTPKIYFGTDKSLVGVNIMYDGQEVLNLKRNGNTWTDASSVNVNQQKAELYARQFNHLFIGQWFTATSNRMADSLQLTKEVVKLTVEDASKALNKELRLYVSATKPEYEWLVLVLPDHQVGLVSKELMAPFLAKRESFKLVQTRSPA